MNRQQLMAIAANNPKFQQGVAILEQRLTQMKVTPEMLQELVKTLEFVLANPDRYAEVRAAAISKGFATERDVPTTFNKVFIISLLVALYAMQDRMQQGAFATGGLAQYGRGGDTELAHINPMEAEVLRRMGGSGTVNPTTGLREFKSGGLGSVLSAIVPTVLDFFVPSLGSALSGTVGEIGKQAVYGAAGSALGGGDWKQGALAGALQGGLGGMAGKAIGDATGLGSGVSNLLGGTLIGGAAGAMGGQGFGKGALSGLIGSGIGQMSQGTQFAAAGQTAGNLLTSGASPQSALVGGALAQLSSAYLRPSDKVVAAGRYDLSTPTSADSTGTGLRVPTASSLEDMGGGTGLKLPSASVVDDTTDMGSGTGLRATQTVTPVPAVPKAGFDFAGLTSKQMISAAPALLSLLGAASTPAQVQQAVTQMTPAQQKYFNLPSQNWDWTKMQADAAQAGMGLGQYMARNWDKLTAGQAYVPPAQKLARGGLSMLMQGAGSGRDDTIHAKLSDGEYVMDAESVALLGDGSTAEGAKRLDQMRGAIRAHKGKVLSKGKISPNAKSPLTYLKEVA